MEDPAKDPGLVTVEVEVPATSTVSPIVTVTSTAPAPDPSYDEPLRRAEMRAEAEPEASPNISALREAIGAIDAAAQTSICLGVEPYIPGSSPTGCKEEQKVEAVEPEHPSLDEQLKEMCALIQAGLQHMSNSVLR